MEEAALGQPFLSYELYFSRKDAKERKENSFPPNLVSNSHLPKELIAHSP